MSEEPIESLAERGANAIHAAFLAYRTEFNAITRRAKVRFEQRDWHGMQDDALERLGLYKKIVRQFSIATPAPTSSGGFDRAGAIARWRWRCVIRRKAS